MEHPGYKRRLYLVDSKFQLWLIGRIAALAAIFIVISLSALAFVYYSYGDITIRLVQPDPFSPAQGIKTVTGEHSLFGLLWPVMLFCLAGALLATLIFGIFLSHRIAGPVYHMQRVISLLGKGDLSQGIRLRKKDAFSPMADKINDLRKYWLDSIRELQSSCRELESGIGEKEREERVKRLCAILEAFKTE